MQALLESLVIYLNALVLRHGTMTSIEPEKSPLNRLLGYEVGYAKSAYSKCRTCGNRIALNELRLGVTWQLVDDQTGQPYRTTTTYWYHLKTFDEAANRDRFCFEEWALGKRRTDVALPTSHLQHLTQEDSVAVSEVLKRVQNALKLTTPAPSIPIPQTQGSVILTGHHPSASQLAPVPAREKNGVTADSWTKSLRLSHTLVDRRLLSKSRECVIVLGDRTGIEKDVLEDTSLAMALYLQQHGVIDNEEEDRLKVTDVVKELLVNNEIRLEAALLDFRVFDPASKNELMRKLAVKTDYKACDVFFCGHGFNDGGFAISNGDRVSGSELAHIVRHRLEVTLYFNCCYAERLTLSACAGIDKESRKEATESVSTSDDGWKCMKVTKTTESSLTTFDRVKGMMLQMLKLAEPDPTVAEGMYAIDLLSENSFDQNPTRVARSNVVRSNKPTARSANKNKVNKVIVDTSSDIKEIAAADARTPPPSPPPEQSTTTSGGKHTGRVTDMLSSASKVLANFSFQLPTGLVLRPFGLDRIAPAGALPSVIAQGFDGSVDEPTMNGWKNWASSLMDALLASDDETKEVIENTFRAKPLPVMSLEELSDHVDDAVPVVTAFNVGQGDSYLISMPAGKDGKGNVTHGFMLIDAGDRGAQKVWWPVVGAVTPLRMLALTHCDADHVGGAVTIVEQFKSQPEKLTAKSYFWGDKVTYMQQGPQQTDRSLKQVAAIQSVLHGQSPIRGTILKVGTYCTVYVLSPTKAMAQAAVLKPDTNSPGYSITQANVSALILLVVWRGDEGKMRKMLFAGDAPWSCVRDGIEYFQTTTLAGADSATKKAIKEVFGAKGDKVDVDLMTVPHHGSTNNMDVDGNYPVNATNIIVCSGDGGIKYSTTMADGTAVTELLEQFSTATAYCTMAKFQAPLKNKNVDARRIEYLGNGESSWALKVE
jgi:hypothetical protein